MKTSLVITSFIFSCLLLTGSLGAAERIALPRCGEKLVTDADRRSFTDITPLRLDLDGDGRAETVRARTYQVKTAKKVRGVTREHWIAFDLERAGTTVRSFYRFKYGTNLADYWVYALIPCRIGREPGTDLLFYAGDDGGSETIILKNTGRSFRVHSRKTSVF